ncbi:MAG: NmrA family NAD(P)-binding protein [Proteobacteria bacterium]|nr:NmrA family NAD(P)-binding protein [Pseudomonadota bacterium]
MREAKILVTSAGGNTGIPTTLQLLEKGFPVRALLHRKDDRSRLLADAGAEVMIADQFSLADMRQAMTGVQRAYHCAPTAPNGLHFGSVFVVAAQEARLEQVVMLGQWLSDADHPSMLTRETWLNEEILKLLPDTAVTINNVGWFAANYFMVLETVAQLGMLPMPLGEGDIRKDAPPSNEDIAAVTVAALQDPGIHAGKTYRPTGPKLLSPNEIAGIMGKVLGRKVTYNNISEKMLLKALKAQGFSGAMPTQLLLYLKEYRKGAFAVHAPNTVVADLTGRQPLEFEEITQRTIAQSEISRPALRNKIAAFRGFLKMLATANVDPDQVEKERDHVLLKSPKFVQESDDWLKSHDPGSGYVPDQSDRPVEPRMGAIRS